MCVIISDRLLSLAARKSIWHCFSCTCRCKYAAIAAAPLKPVGLASAPPSPSYKLNWPRRPPEAEPALVASSDRSSASRRATAFIVTIGPSTASLISLVAGLSAAPLAWSIRPNAEMHSVTGAMGSIRDHSASSRAPASTTEEPLSSAEGALPTVPTP